MLGFFFLAQDHDNAASCRCTEFSKDHAKILRWICTHHLIMTAQFKTNGFDLLTTLLLMDPAVPYPMVDNLKMMDELRTRVYMVCVALDLYFKMMILVYKCVND